MQPLRRTTERREMPMAREAKAREEARQRAAERRCSRAPLRTGALLEEPDELATRVVRGMGDRRRVRPVRARKSDEQYRL